MASFSVYTEFPMTCSGKRRAFTLIGLFPTYKISRPSLCVTETFNKEDVVVLRSDAVSLCVVLSTFLSTVVPSSSVSSSVRRVVLRNFGNYKTSDTTLQRRRTESSAIPL